MGHMHRARWGHILELWMDDELDPARIERVLRHLSECADCAGEVEELACLKRALAHVTTS